MLMQSKESSFRKLFNMKGNEKLNNQRKMSKSIRA